jgi:hypothetical protein
MIKFFHYLFGLALIIFGVIMFSWFYDDFSYSVAHITNPQYFARLFAPITALYLGIFYIYCAFKNKITLMSKISFFILVIGMLVSYVIMIFTPYQFGGTMPQYGLIMDSIWRTLMPLSVISSVIFSFVSFIHKKQIPES